MTGKAGYTEMLSNHRMFSLEKKDYGHFDGCFHHFKNYCVTTRRILRPTGDIPVGQWGENVRERFVLMFSEACSKGISACEHSRSWLTARATEKQVFASDSSE